MLIYRQGATVPPTSQLLALNRVGGSASLPGCFTAKARWNGASQKSGKSPTTQSSSPKSVGGSASLPGCFTAKARRCHPRAKF